MPDPGFYPVNRARLWRAFILGVFLLVTLRVGAQTAWDSRDIGVVGAVGSSSDSGGSVSVRGSGADIWDRADAFHFRYRAWTGDGEFVARLTSLSNTNAWAKAGLMFRETLAADSRHALMCGTAANGTILQYRTATGGECALTGITWASTFPVWLKIVRSGDTFAGFTSVDGTSWTPAGSVTLAGAPASMYVGLAITSHNDGSIATAFFDNVTSSAPNTGAGAPVITVRPSETIHSGSLYTYQIVASNSPTHYSASGLPAGLTLNPDTGDIRGVCGWNGGTYSVTLRATNASGTGSAIQTMEVNGSGPIEMPYIRELTPPADGVYRVGDVLVFRVRFGIGYSYPFVTGRPRIALTIGGNTRYADYAWGSGNETQGYAYVVSPADVPATGMSISDTIDLNGGAIQDSYHLWCALNMTPVNAPNIRLESASGSPTAAPVVDMSDATTGLYGTQCSLQLTATGAPTSYGLTFGPTPTRPLGLSFNPNTGTLSGVVQASGNYTLNVSATNGAGTGTKTVTLVIPHVVAQLETPPPGTYRAGDALAFRVTFSNPVVITDVPALNVQIGSVLRQASRTSGSGQVHTFVYTVQPGDVDRDGVVMVGRNIIGGTIRDAETGVDFARQLPGESMPSDPIALPGLFVEAPGTTRPEITSSTTASGTVGILFNYTITATNGPASYGASPLPPGLTLNASSGVISGTPTASGTFAVTISATNSGGTGSATLTISIDGGNLSTWSSRDIGAVAAAGSSSETGGVVTVRGSGADIWDASDEFHFRFQQLTGDGELIARITSLNDTHAWAKAGLMFRETLTSDSRYGFICMTAENGTAAQQRPTTGGTTFINTPSWATSFPMWLRITRTEDQLNYYTSTDGSAWAWQGAVGMGSLAGTLYVGFAVTSHNDGVIANATFDNVRFARSAAAPTPPSALVLSAPSPTQVNLTWTDNSNNETMFRIERSTDNAVFGTVASPSANVTSYADTGLTGGTTYYYRVRAMNSVGASTYAAASITTPVAPPPSAWNFGDVGPVGIAGSNSSSGNTITIRGSGQDIWDTVDAFRFVYRAVQGDVTVEAQVSSISPTHPWAKAGVMIRDSLDGNARNVFALVTPDSLVAAQARTSAGGTTELAAAGWFGVPYWVRLVRTGTRITAYASRDAASWTEIARYDVALADTVYVGFAVTSHDNAQLNTAVFTDPSVR
jgi:PKD repeat protein